MSHRARARPAPRRVENPVFQHALGAVRSPRRARSSRARRLPPRLPTRSRTPRPRADVDVRGQCVSSPSRSLRPRRISLFSFPRAIARFSLDPRPAGSPHPPPPRARALTPVARPPPPSHRSRQEAPVHRPRESAEQPPRQRHGLPVPLHRQRHRLRRPRVHGPQGLRRVPRLQRPDRLRGPRQVRLRPRALLPRPRQDLRRRRERQRGHLHPLLDPLLQHLAISSEGARKIRERPAFRSVRPERVVSFLGVLQTPPIPLR